MRAIIGLGLFAVALLAGSLPAAADCVVGASMATRFQAIDSNTIILLGGSKILVQIFCCVHSSSSVTVLKDSFCSYDNAALFIDGNVVDVRSVRRLD
jgi:hypothetical protein